LDVAAAINRTHISDRCPRQQAAGMCSSTTCNAAATGAGGSSVSGGECRDKWSHAECVCGEGFTGKNCETSELCCQIFFFVAR
jgi:hypothetical protein